MIHSLFMAVINEHKYTYAAHTYTHKQTHTNSRMFQMLLINFNMISLATCCYLNSLVDVFIFEQSQNDTSILNY